MALTFIGDIVLGPGFNTITASGYPSVSVTLVAHPSNGSIIYVRNSATTGYGFPLAAGERLTLDYADLHDYTVSGAANSRLAWAAHK